MKKVLAFLLVMALTLGCLGFAHAAVTKNQEELAFYPVLEVGDPTVLEGITASMTLACGPHLRWYPQHTFGGDTVTQFDYSRKRIEEPLSNERFMSASLLNESDIMYSSQYHSVVAGTPVGGSLTNTVPVCDILDYYSPDFDIEYRDETKEFVNHYDTLSALSNLFRFPVQEGDTVSITMEKDNDSSYIGRSVHLENGPWLSILYDMNADGVWFLPEFRNENGPLPYESPAGHGIYYMPWASVDHTSPDNSLIQVKAGVSALRLYVPLDDEFEVMDLFVAPERKTAHLLTLEDGRFILSTYDLDSGDIRSRLELLPGDPDQRGHGFIYRYRGDYLLLMVRDQFVLTDAAGENVLINAPIPKDQGFNVGNFDPESGDLYFDGETLIIADHYEYDETIFAVTAWSEGSRIFYGEYGCSLSQSNKDWYYSYVKARDLELQNKEISEMTREEG